MIIHDVLQGSLEWFAVRAGKLTASNAQAIAAQGKGLESLVWETLAAKYATTQEELWSNADMERGKELECLARMAYSAETGELVDEVGFVEHDEYCGCSPDGLVGEDGGIEIKCHNNTKFFQFSVEKEIDSKYQWQIQMNLLITGRKWWDYVAYSQNFENGLVIVRVFPDQKMQEKILAGLEKGREIIKGISSRL